jgi:hypothetical protein
MTGTNEIGGIYVGLATNQANVAQAELVGTWKMTGTTNCVFNTSSLTYGSPSNYTTADADCNNPTVTGDLTSIGKVPGFSFTAKPGRYYIVATASFRKTNATTSDAKFRLTDGTNVGPSAIIYTSTAEEIISSFDTSYNIEISSVTSKTIYLDGVVGNAAETASIQNTDSLRQIYFQVYRFPTSSELVVTPERQNVFAGAQWSGTKGFQRANTTEITVSDTVYSTNRSLFGKAQFTGTANDLAITVPAMPPGTYKVELSSNYLSAQRVSTGTGDFGCQFTLKDNSGVVATSAAAQYGVQYSINSITVVSAVTTYTSVADRTFTAYLQSANAASTVDCYVSAPKIIITPLDQPSNSALYVQGPVQASATGATIAASYIGEVVTNASDATNTASGTTRNCGTLTLQPGVWDVYATQGTDFVVTNPNVTKIIVSISTTTGTLGTGIDKLTIPMPATAALGFGAYTVGPKRVNITSATPYYCVSQITASGNVDYVNSQLKAVRVN